ncbi:tetratricopeptide repeat protein [Pseudooctadecabacter sp.]|uniref:tetratricopeptide repeat protein n=1 Tax=Pseudooctadecabacter sp. TaxID=1966338 RepID=UPI0025F583EC|nr:tetratricopeptide repeat protein [Pseudooctadecabacter sp.]
MRYATLITLTATSVAAECPEGQDYTAQLAALVAQMQVAPDEGAARALSGQMWEIWLDAPDALAQGMLQEGVALLRMGDTNASRAALSELIDYCPDYAEGYNQRAFAAFLSGDFEGALVDLDRAIGLRPQHLGALTGKALTLIELDRNEEAQEVLRAALRINPWLAERALLDGPLDRDI